jgi:hypothetical protein
MLLSKQFFFKKKKRKKKSPNIYSEYQNCLLGTQGKKERRKERRKRGKRGKVCKEIEDRRRWSSSSFLGETDH